jgi:hypothetical protein
VTIGPNRSILSLLLGGIRRPKRPGNLDSAAFSFLPATWKERADSPERRFLQGWLHFQRREVTAARDLWDGLASGSLDTPELAYYLALSLHETGEDARAVRLLRQVVASEEASFPSRARSQLAHIQSAEHGHTH